MLLCLCYDSLTFTVNFEKIKIDDSRMSKSWGQELRRIVLTSNYRKKSGKIRIQIGK